MLNSRLPWKSRGFHDIERNHFATCFKQGLNSLDRAQLPSVAHLPLAQCVHKLTIANGHDVKAILGWVPVNLTAPTVAPPVEPMVTADVLAATIVKQLQDNFARGKGVPRREPDVPPPLDPKRKSPNRTR